jgi:WS/DGAT/MGAT family acyltransferase
MERINSLDAVFVAVEDRVNVMNIGSVAVFEGPPPSFDEVRSLFAAKIPLVPRCRQRLREPSGFIGRPVWIDDGDFELDDHLRFDVLPSREMSALEAFVGEFMARPLERSRSLWEAALVHGLGDGRWAIVAKVHHCMVDGIAGADLLATVMDSGPDVGSEVAQTWTPSRAPSTLEFAWFSAASAAKSALRHARGASDVLAHPRRSFKRARRVLGAAKRLWYPVRRGATPLTGPISPRRRWMTTRVGFDDVRTIGDALGGTVNDVMAAAVTWGFRELLESRGEVPDGRTVTALVPVSLRRPDDDSRLGNELANVHGLLPIGVEDLVAAFRAVHAQFDDLKGSNEVDATGVVMHLGDYVPRVVADGLARAIIRRQRKVEVVVTDVAGPRLPLYLGGRRLLEGYPYAPIAGHVRIAVAIWSYCGHLYFGVTGDGDTVSDLGRLVSGIDDGFAGLVAEAAKG